MNVISTEQVSLSGKHASRPRMAISRSLRTSVPTVIALVVIASVGATSVWRVYDNDRQVAHTYEVKSALDALLSAVTDAETGQRGFMITGDAAYLSPYERGTATIQDALGHIASVTADNPSQRRRLPALRTAVDEKLSELASSVAARRTDGFEAALRIVRTNVGKATMERIRAIIAEMDREENVRLDARRAQTAVRFWITIATDAGVTLIALVLLALFANVSRRRLTDAEAREALALRLAAIVESSEDAIVAKDLNSTITAWNAAAERLFGYAANEAIGQSIRVVIPPDRQHEENEVLARLRRGETIKHFDTVRMAKNGRLIEVSLTVSPIRNASGEIVGASKIARDLTPLRLYATELEQKVGERTADLQAANARLEAFAFSVAHDLRAPLRGMHGIAQALLEDYGDRLDATGRDYARRIVDEATSMDVLTNDLLAYGRLSHVELAISPVELGDVVEASVYAVRDDLQRSGAHVDIESGLPTVQGNRSVLIQVFSNLLSNAVKFGGREPHVRVWAETREARIAHIWVEDQGIGIAPEHQDRIFGVFERLHGAETYPGTGIGLAIVKKGIERLGGRVGVESQEGHGSRFWVELPRAEAA
jgi:PAS domain S-box-containing protein